MITPKQLLAALVDAGYQDLAGVPCSTLADVYDELAADGRITYHPAPHEGSAFAMVCGLLLAGRRAAVLMQNSGFGNMVNPLTSLAMPYGIPVVTFMTMRGWPDADPGEAQHTVMGQHGRRLVEALDLPWYRLPSEPAELPGVLAKVAQDAGAGRPAFVLVTAGSLAPPRPAPPAAAGTGISRAEAIRAIVRRYPDALIVSTIGYTSRDLFALADRPENLYLQGAMGHAISVGAGLAAAGVRQRVVVLDGDGSALMHLSAMALVGRLLPANLIHVVLDNGGYESTGGQPLAAPDIDFERVALGCGYRRVCGVGSLAELGEAADTEDGPILLRVAIRAHTPPAGARATATVSPVDLARRFSARVAGGRG